MAGADAASGEHLVSAYRLADDVEIKSLKIDLLTTPTLEVGVFGVINIPYHLREVLISGNSADVIGRSCAGSVLADSLFREDVQPESFLQFNRMSPVVAEVVCIGESAPAL